MSVKFRTRNYNQIEFGLKDDDNEVEVQVTTSELDNVTLLWLTQEQIQKLINHLKEQLV